MYVIARSHPGLFVSTRVLSNPLNWSSQTTFRCPFRLGNECQGSGKKTGNCLIELNFLLLAEKQKKVFVLSKLHSCNISVIEKAQSDASF